MKFEKIVMADANYLQGLKLPACGARSTRVFVKLCVCCICIGVFLVYSKLTWLCYLLLYNISCFGNVLHVMVLQLGPVYTIPFSYEDGTEMFRFGLPSTLYRFPIWHQIKTGAYENT